MNWLNVLAIVELPCACIGLIVLFLWAWETIQYLTVELRWQRRHKARPAPVEEETHDGVDGDSPS